MVQPLNPGATIGILGGGQLGRMLAMAAARLGHKTHVFSDGSDACAFDVAHAHTIGDFEDVAAVEAFARHVDVVTYEFENVPVEAAQAAERHRPLRPGSRSLAVAQDRLEEKRFIAGLGIPVAPFAAVSSATAFAAGLSTVGAPALLKTRRLGYDGKGQVRVDAASIGDEVFAQIGGAPAIVEGFVSFAYEVSVIVVRGLDGDIRFYDVPLNKHRDGILHQSVVPSPLPASAQQHARDIARRIAVGLDHVGVLAVEMFYMGDGALEPLLVNEIAPRVHNSGHWTLEACVTSQFESHIRAIAGWPLGSTERHSDAVMQNLIGSEIEQWRELAAAPDVAIHHYGKGLARPGRKMGHFTRLAPRR
jgi:5-(carboxyamino)imidazole ribonucleotide synthase